MLVPPFELGVVHVATEDALALLVQEVSVGAPGAVAGVAVADGAEYAPVPAGLVADTWNMYPVPLVNPVTL
jgi:hypothetical protein